MKKLFLATIIFFATVNVSWAACSWNGNIATPSSLAVAGVQECVTGASTRTGEVTIYLPAGTATWSSTLTVNMSSGFANVTSLSIIGAGTIPTGSTKGAASSGGTTINITATTGVLITGSTSKKFRISNITWTGGVDQTGYFIRFNGTSLVSSGGGFRVDHHTWNNTTTRTRKVITEGRIYGVVDHNYYRGAAETKWYGMFGDVGEGQAGGNASWYRGIGINSWDQVFFEDNDVGQAEGYTGGSATFFTDCTNGGRVVARHNTIRNMYFGGHGADTVKRSCLSQVVHDNTINIVDVSAGNMNPWIDARDTTWVAYDNAITETRSGSPVTNSMWGGVIYLRNYRSYSGWSTSNTDPFYNLCDGGTEKGCFGTTLSSRSCTTDADCGGETGACSAIDGNTGTAGYPCRDQTGYTSTGGYGASQLVAYPSLFANNTRNSVAQSPTVPTTGYNDDHIQADRDYCTHSTTLPVTCNSVATEYTELAYPHPLLGGGGESDTTDPVISGIFPTVEQPCDDLDDTEDISIGLTTTDQNVTTCKWGTSTAAYADLPNTMDGAAAGTANHTDTAAGLACAGTRTIYYSCQDAEGNTTDTASWSFNIATRGLEDAPVITSVTSAKQAVALTQKLSVTTDIGASCRYCVNGVSGCASDTAWASRTAFSVTGGETTHHEVAITQTAGTTATYNVLCQSLNNVESINSAITITTDSAKTITAGSGSLSITQGTGTLSITILP